MKEIQIRKNDAGQRLDRFVGKAVPLLPESLLQKYIRLKRIKRNGKAAKRDVRLVKGDVLQLYINDEFFEKPTEHNAWLKIATPRLDIVYEDENILLADKKPGVLCHSAGEWSWDTLISNISGLPAPERRVGPEGGKRLYPSAVQPHRPQHRRHRHRGEKRRGAAHSERQDPRPRDQNPTSASSAAAPSPPRAGWRGICSRT